MTSLDAKRAGRALFQATQPHGTARATLDGLVEFMALLQENAELREVVTSVFVPASVKVGIIEQVADQLGTVPAARQTLLILAQMHQPAGLAGIVKELKALVHRQERRIDAEVTTAVALDEDHVARLRDALAQATGQQVSVSTRVDPAVIGGAVTRVGSVVYDGSLARQLARMKEQFVQQG
ncbi:ATP synthase subunit delta [Luteitalea sp. TBR-22]|uniref:ATP synthase F1 subunit delta n=1 Tax=Luteitalea sp. TBR-22 TaxID=2802971 RepID=UPI001AFBB8ED|nr:ATP synthase F1 subunit delta [Luteitalea sp. TBR-22]BCS36114.1 ATP synthase subunit delta [Luteitalea sp. TBR-22]